MNLDPQNKFSLFCVFSSAAKFFKKIDPIETRFRQYTDFIVSELGAYHVI